MTDWYDEQCLMDGREVPEKTEEERSKSQMEQNEENKGFKGSGIGRGGVFGGPPKAMNAPPPQTSFGATSGTRIGGAFGSQSNGPDGRGTPIGSDDVGGGGGNVVSVGVHRDRSACFSQGGGFGTNRSMTPNSPTSFKNNHEGGRFGTLAPKSTGGAFSSSSSSGDVDKLKIGGSFGSSQNAESTRSSVGGSFGSLRTAHTSSSISRSSIGGAFGSKSSSSDATAKVGSSIGGSFGASRSSNDPPPTVGAGFGSSKSTTSGSVGGSFGSRPKGFASAAAGFRNPVPEEENQSQPIGKVFPTSQVVPTQTWKAVFSPQRPGAGPEELIDQGSWYGVFCGKVGNATGSDVPSDPITGKARNDETATSGSVEVPKNFSASTASFTNAKSSGSSERIGGAFGASRRVTQEIPDLTSPPPIFGSRSADTKSSATHTVVSETIAGGFFAGSQENRDPTPTGNIADFDRSKSGSSGQVPAENLVLRGGFGAGIGRNAETPTFGGSSRANRSGLQENTSGAPFMGNQQQPQMRGGFQGGYRGGRGSGGQMDFGAGQGHSMGRGRGQPFVPQQRSTPPPFAGPNGPMVTPDPRYKYTKPQADIHDKAPVPADIALLNKFIQKEVINEGNVEVKRDDPKSPLYSISSFRELRLKQEVLEALDILNFQFPTRIQETALPLLLMEPPSNLIAQAQSGTGKTAAFVLTMLCRIDVDLPYPQCICLAPTLELAKQIGEVVEKMGQKVANLRIHYAIKGGNMAAMRGRKLTEQIVIGTPGITRDYLQKYKCIDPSKIRCLVLDEADVMIYHQGFTDISTTIYNMVEEASDSVQSMLFSATYDEPVINFATKIIKNAIVVMLKREEQALPNIKQFYVQCACRDSKYAAIVNLYSGLAVASSVIFCHTKASVMWLFENMKARGHQVDVLHGDMTVVERADTIIRFKQGDFKVLITTNVFARGIDVAQVSVVINYDLPIKYDDTGNPMVIDGFTQPDCETYLHRIGRTGRFGKKGIAINFIDSEDSMNMINVLEKHFQMKITRMDPSNLVELEAIEIA